MYVLKLLRLILYNRT